MVGRRARVLCDIGLACYGERVDGGGECVLVLKAATFLSGQT